MQSSLSCHTHSQVVRLGNNPLQVNPRTNGHDCTGIIFSYYSAVPIVLLPLDRGSGIRSSSQSKPHGALAHCPNEDPDSTTVEHELEVSLRPLDPSPLFFLAEFCARRRSGTRHRIIHAPHWCDLHLPIRTHKASQYWSVAS